MSEHSRSIRVFLSSTFLDMQAERDYLVKNTFPAISRLAKKRDVDFYVVDLRWGVTEEEANQGKVIEVCLNQVEETRPFFIGLIGDRYGWCPIQADIAGNQRLRNAYPWVEDLIQQGLSITEIEMRFGVMMSQEHIYAEFYIKDGKGQTEPDEAKKGKLEALRQMVQQKGEEGICGVHHYSSLKQLGDNVYRSLVALLDELYPENDADPTHVLVDKQRYLLHQYQTIYANHEGLVRMDYMLRHAGEDAHWIWVLTGPSGIGKTALIANWRKDDPNIIRTILDEQLFRADQALQHLEMEIAERGVERKKVIWILDGIEHLTSQEDRKLVWLGNEKLNDINIILTTKDSEMEKKAQAESIQLQRHFSTLPVPVAKPNEIRDITTHYLKQFAKGLEGRQLDRIARHELFSNVLFLKFFLQELIQFGVYEQLDEFIQSYLDAKTPEELLQIIFTRLCHDYGEHAVTSYFGMLALTQFGIPESDLQEFTGLNAINWAALCSATSLYVMRADGILSIRSIIREEAQHYFFRSEEQVNEWRRKLIKLYTRMIKNIHRAERKEDLFNYILGRIFKVSFSDKNGWTFNKLSAERLTYEAQLYGVQKAFRHVSFMEAMLIGDVRQDTLTMYLSYINGSAKRLIRGISYPTLYILDSFISLSFNLLQDPKERKRFYNYIRRQLIPKSVKNKLLKLMEPYMSDKEEISQRFGDYDWADMELEEIDAIRVAMMTITHLPYTTDDERIIHIDGEADKVIQRFKNQKDRDDTGLCCFYIVKSYCLYYEQAYKKAYQYYSMAVQHAPINNANIIRFLVTLGVERYDECRAIINDLQAIIDTSTNEYTGKTSGQTLYLMKWLLALRLDDKQEAEEVKQQVLSLYEASDPTAYNYRFNTANILRNHAYWEEAGDMYLHAVNAARTAGDRISALCSAGECYEEIQDTDTARKIYADLEKAYLAQGQKHNAHWAFRKHAGTYLIDCNKHIIRSRIKQCYDQYIAEMNVAFQHPKEEIEEPSYYAFHVNYFVEISQAELTYHFWGADSGFIQDIADRMQSLYDEPHPLTGIEWIYTTCMLAADRLDKITNIHCVHDRSAKNRYVIEHTRQTDEKAYEEQIVPRFRTDIDVLFGKFKDLRVISLDAWNRKKAEERFVSIYRDAWNPAMEIYRLPILRPMVEKGTDDERPKAVLAMILYSYVTENQADMAYYRHEAEKYDYEPLSAVLQCLNAM